MTSAISETLDGLEERGVSNDFWMRWGLADDTNDARQFRRLTSLHNAHLYDLNGRQIVSCKMNNLSSGGLHAKAPAGYGLAVGQRYEVRFGSGTPHELHNLSVYATVVRTELKVNRDELGVGMRFDNPLYLSSR